MTFKAIIHYEDGIDWESTMQLRFIKKEDGSRVLQQMFISNRKEGHFWAWRDIPEFGEDAEVTQ